MKKLNNALNDINDSYIDEAAKATRLENKTARIVRNITVPLASAAAVAGVCIGLNGLGVFGTKPQGVDLLPADSTSSDMTSASTAVFIDDRFEIPHRIDFPEELPVVQMTQDDIMSVKLSDEQRPDMVYASNTDVIFTDGSGGLYIYDISTEQMKLAADIWGSFGLSVDGIVNEDIDYEEAFDVFALMDGKIYCTYTYNTLTLTGKDSPTAMEYYLLNTEKLTLTRDETMQTAEVAVYDGLNPIPDEMSYHSLSQNAARIGNTGDYVFIRNSTADIDLFPSCDLLYIELRRISENEEPEDCMDGGFFPFSDISGIEEDFDAESLIEYLKELHADFSGEIVCPEFVQPLDQIFVTTEFGYDEWRGSGHSGIDLAAELGDPIYAAADGTAYTHKLEDGWFGGYGNTVIIQHDGGYFTVYAHVNEIHVTDGERVTAGQHIADVGSTGWSTGPHLHFEARAGLEPIQPSANTEGFGSWGWYLEVSLPYAIYMAYSGVSYNGADIALECPVTAVRVDEAVTEEPLLDREKSEITYFAASDEPSVRASAGGQVIYVGGYMAKEKGTCVAVMHDDGYVVVYRRLSSVSVEAGDMVSTGDILGEVGEESECIVEVIINKACEKAPISYITFKN